MNRHVPILFIMLLLLAPLHVVEAQGGDLLARVNNLRASVGLSPYALNGVLSAAAQSQAQWMADSGVISHNRPDGSSPRSRALNSGYPTVDVSENIYGGTLAGVDSAWSFWVNSPIHYNGIVNNRYSEVGVGIASGSIGNTFVLVFGNPGGPAPGAPQIASSGGGGGGASVAPSYVVGEDESGNIMHRVQPGDTLGDIALIYGYTWDDLAYMRQLNNLEGNMLDVDSIFLVPPQAGTWTPQPGQGGENASAATPEAAVEVAQEPTAEPSATSVPTLEPSPTSLIIATSAAMPEVIAMMAAITSETPTPLVVAASIGPAPEELQGAIEAGKSSGTITRSGTSPWLAVGLLVQVGVLIVAGFEFARRSKNTRSKGKRR